MIFRQLLDLRSFTYTYLLADRPGGSAVLIDPVFEQAARDVALVQELELTLLYTLETHVHADHVTGAWLLRQQFGSQIAVSCQGGTRGHDLLVDDGDRIAFGERALRVAATPGHTNGCVTYVLDDESMAFTGDALLIRGAGRTDFQQGDARTLYRSIHDKIFTLPDTCMLYPGHDYSGRMATSVAEEKLHNPRLGGKRSVEDFAGFMNNLGLPHPKQIDVAVPGNLVCGEPSKEAQEHSIHAWAPLRRSYAGVPELPAEWLAEHLREVRIIDVREADEFEGELGHIEGAELVPLAGLGNAMGGWERDKPIVVVCRSGGRSAQAALILEKAGFDCVANLAQGMIGWRAGELPPARGSERPEPA